MPDSDAHRCGTLWAQQTPMTVTVLTNCFGPPPIVRAQTISTTGCHGWMALDARLALGSHPLEESGNGGVRSKRPFQ